MVTRPTTKASTIANRMRQHRHLEQDQCIHDVPAHSRSA